jgi:dihydroorotate dehydrogenase (fumarate)
VIDLTTTYLGLPLHNPLVVSAGPLCETVGNLRHMEDAGAAAVVLPSLFEEQIELESLDLNHCLSGGGESYAEALSYFPDMVGYNRGPEGYLEHVRRAKEAVDIPVIGSLNGVSPGGWVRYAKEIEAAGADALELNIYYLATDPDRTGPAIEDTYCRLVQEVRAGIRIPLAVKIGPYFTALANLARRLDQAGAGALVLFNRFYQPDLDLENLEVTPTLTLSTPQELLLRLHWVAVLYRRIHADLAVTGGVHTAREVLKAMMAGARVAMMTSALLKNGIGYLAEVRGGLLAWMEDHGYESIRQMQGSMSQRSVAEPAAFERANYLRVLRSYTLRPPARGGAPFPVPRDAAR